MPDSVSATIVPRGINKGRGWLRRFRDWRQALARAEHKAEQAEARLRAAIDALPEGLVFLDHEGRFVLWNQRYAEIYNRSADLFAPGAKLIDVLRTGLARGDYPDALGREDQWLADRIAVTNQPGVRHEQQVADGRWLMLESRRTSDGGVIGLRIDITEMKQQAQALQAAVERAEAANRAKAMFLANLSHEIRTPLNGVLGLSDVLARTTLDPAQRDVLDTITASAGALDGILTDLLDFSLLETGDLEVQSKPFDLAEAVRQAAAPFERAARDKRIGLEVRIADSLERVILGDGKRVKQVLTNLLSNALKFTETGLIKVTASASAQGDRCYIEVRDSGVGFDPKDSERLFSRFEQGDGSITRKYGGTGLGLAICRRLAELMGGAVTAASQPGRGAVFTLMLPMVAAQAPKSGLIEAANDEGPLRVLVVDDNPTNRKVAQLILEAIGAEVVCVENGQEGVEAVRSRVFDVVLMDIQMPVMDGLTATRAIRAREAAEGLPATPVVMLSANVLREHVEASTAAGANGHLAKPIRAETLISAVVDAAQGEMELAATG